MKKVLLLLSVLCLFIGQNVHAGVYTGKIKEIMASTVYGNYAYLILHSAPLNPSSCQTNTTYRYAIDLSTDVGKTMFAMVMTAQASNKIMYIVGVDVCNQHGAEFIKQIHIRE